MADNGKPTMFNSMYGDLGKHNAFTVHNLNGRRYYSSIDATILFGDEIVDEIIQIQWTVDQQTMPLFGYNSYVWDDVARGSRIITGAFAINFVIPDYLDYVLDKKINDEAFRKSRQIIENKHNYIFPEAFSICIGYGDYKTPDKVLGKNPCTTLENVIVKSSGQALDTQGAKLVELYQFIARDRSAAK